MELPKSIEHFQILLFGTIAMAMLVMFIILFVVKYQYKRIQEQEERNKLNEKNQEKILEAILIAQENEQKRISRDLHDELGSALSIAKMNVGHISKSIIGDDKIEIATDTFNILEDALKNVRRLSKDIHPVMLEKYGLLEAVEALGKKFTSDMLQVSITKPEMYCPLSSQQELNIFRILQELLNNTLKYAQASTAKIDFCCNDNTFSVTYSDNGIGFNYDRNNFRGDDGFGIGMITIATRVRMLEGAWQMESAEGKGTLANFQIPLVSNLSVNP